MFRRPGHAESANPDKQGAAAEIQGGYEEASLSASDAVYELRCERDVWRIARRGPLKIS